MKRSFQMPKRNKQQFQLNTPEKQLNCLQLPNIDNCKIHKSEEQQSIGAYSDDDIIILQIKHLRKQNQFLRKKIQQLQSERRQILLQGFSLIPPRKRKPFPGFRNKARNNVQRSLQFFFKQANDMIESVLEVFKINFQPHQQKIYLSQENILNSASVEKSHYMNKEIIYRKLQTILIEDQHKRYPDILQLFTDFYRTRVQAQRHTIQYVDQMSQRMLQLNKWLLQKAKKIQTQNGDINDNKSVMSKLNSEIKYRKISFDQDARSEQYIKKLGQRNMQYYKSQRLTRNTIDPSA